jgi:hypothetical protein
MMSFIDCYSENDFLKNINLDTLVSKPTDFINNFLTESITDIVLSCNATTNSGELINVLIIVEEQTESQRLMGLRNVSYVVDYYKRLLKEKPADNKPIMFPFPIVIVIHPGKEWTKFYQMEDLIEGAKKFPKNILFCPVQIINLAQLTAEKRKGDLQLQALFLTLQAAADGEMDSKIDEIFSLLSQASKNISDSDKIVNLLTDFITFIFNFISKNNNNIQVVTEKIS